MARVATSAARVRAERRVVLRGGRKQASSPSLRTGCQRSPRPRAAGWHTNARVRRPACAPPKLHDDPIACSRPATSAGCRVKNGGAIPLRSPPGRPAKDLRSALLDRRDRARRSVLGVAGRGPAPSCACAGRASCSRSAAPTSRSSRATRLVRFVGDDAASCRLVAGPVRAANLMSAPRRRAGRRGDRRTAAPAVAGPLSIWRLLRGIGASRVRLCCRASKRRCSRRRATRSSSTAARGRRMRRVNPTRRGREWRSRGRDRRAGGARTVMAKRLHAKVRALPPSGWAALTSPWRSATTA